jgi:hypothetical protein
MGGYVPSFEISDRVEIFNEFNVIFEYGRPKKTNT